MSEISSPDEPRPPIRLWFRAAVLAILVVWLAVRVVYWNGFYSEDSPGYVTDAIYAATGNYHARHDVNGLNVGTSLPVAVPIKIFGKSEVALSIWPLLCSFLGMASLGAAAAMLFGRAYGLLAALLYATYPGDIFFSTVVMPDAIQAGWLSVALFLIVRAFATAAPPRYRILAAAGLAMGICHLIRANDVILVPVGLSAVVLLARLWKKAPAGVVVRGCMVFLSGWIFVNLVEGLVYLSSAGDFFHRFRVLAAHYGTLASHERWGLNADLTTIPFSIFPFVPWWMHGGWGSFNPGQAYHALTFVAAIVALAGGVAALALESRSIPAPARAGFALGALWIAWPLLFHQFGSQSLTEFVPMHRLPRHLVVYAPGAIFATVAGCFLMTEAAARWRVSRRRMAVMLIPVLLLQLGASVNGITVAHEEFQRIKRTYVRIRARLPQDVNTIVADPGDLSFLDFWLNPLGTERVTMAAFARYSSCDQLTAGVVVTRSNPGWEHFGAPVIQDTVRRLPCLVHPPPSWRLLYDGYPEKVFVIGGGLAR